MRETGYRRQYRQLGPALDPKRMVDKYEPSLTSESTVASAQTEGWSDWEDDCKRKTFQTSNEVPSPEELRQSVDDQFDTEAPQSPGGWTANSPIKSPSMPTPKAPHSHLRPRSVRSNSSKVHADWVFRILKAKIYPLMQHHFNQPKEMLFILWNMLRYRQARVSLIYSFALSKPTTARTPSRMEGCLSVHLTIHLYNSFNVHVLEAAFILWILCVFWRKKVMSTKSKKEYQSQPYCNVARVVTYR